MEQKTIYMKLLIIGMLSSLFISCNNTIEKTYFDTYVYTNNSSHSILIEKYANESKITYELPKLKTINFKLELNSGDCNIDNNQMTSVLGGCLLIFADSLKIIFDNDKSILLKPKDTRDINIFNEGNYENATVGNKSTHNYIFSEKDYLEAN